ncbi:MAG: TolC family outer membrane protein [Sulfuritalea sp.]|nr:TolC family outer membrane protein [Sulfuritalea sp.]
MGVSQKALLLAVALLFLRAEESAAAPAAHLTLREVAQKVVLTNPEVLSKWHAFKAAGGDVDVARAGFFPRLDYSTAAAREKLRQPGVADRDYNRNGYTLTLNQMLYDGFATSSDVKRLDKARLTRYFELLDAAENAALEAGRVYYDVIRYRQLMFLAENNFIEHRASYEQLLRRAQAGAGRRVDVEHAAGRLALAELNLTTEAANLHDVMARFLRLVGDRPPPVMFGPARLGADYPASEQEALKATFKTNPALRASLENVESAQHDVELRRSAFHPKLDLRVRNENTGNYQGVTGSRENNVAEVVLSYNLFNGGADMARQRAYADRKSLAVDLRDKSCRDVRQTTSIAYNDVLRLRSQLANLDLQVSSIEKTRDAYKAQFNIGQRSLLDLLDTENELLNARRTAVNADADLALAYLRTQAGIGRLLQFLGLKRIDNEEAPDASELTPVVESDICPPEAPKNYLVDLDALTVRALALLDASGPAGDATGVPRPVAPPPLPVAPSVAPAVPSSRNAPVPLSYPPPMPPRTQGSSAQAVSPLVLSSLVLGAPPKESEASRPPPATLEVPMPPLAASTALGLASAETMPPMAGEGKKTAPAPSQGRILTDRVKAWAAAWSAKAYAAYTGFYAPSFVPADGSSRASWEKQRAQRLAKPDRVQVEVRNFRLNEVAKDVFIAEFEQRYSSDSYSDTTIKALRWVKLGGEWLIEREAMQSLSSRAADRHRSGK